jgi:hypothetical protein
MILHRAPFQKKFGARILLRKDTRVNGSDAEGCAIYLIGVAVGQIGAGEELFELDGMVAPGLPVRSTMASRVARCWGDSVDCAAEGVVCAAGPTPLDDVSDFATGVTVMHGTFVGLADALAGVARNCCNVAVGDGCARVVVSHPHSPMDKINPAKINTFAKIQKISPLTEKNTDN